MGVNAVFNSALRLPRPDAGFNSCQISKVQQCRIKRVRKTGAAGHCPAT